jgi:hypothetical protein
LQPEPEGIVPLQLLRTAGAVTVIAPPEHGSGVRTGSATGTKAPYEQLRLSVPVLSDQPVVFDHEHTVLCNCTAPATHPPVVVPAGCAGSVHGAPDTGRGDHWPAVQVICSAPEISTQFAVWLYVQLKPDACKEPGVGQPVTPAGSGEGTAQGFGDSTGAGVVNEPARQVR